MIPEIYRPRCFCGGRGWYPSADEDPRDVYCECEAGRRLAEAENDEEDDR